MEFLTPDCTWTSPGYCDHLGSEPLIGRSFSLCVSLPPSSLPSVSPSLPLCFSLSVKIGAGIYPSDEDTGWDACVPHQSTWVQWLASAPDSSFLPMETLGGSDNCANIGFLPPIWETWVEFLALASRP